MMKVEFKWVYSQSSKNNIEVRVLAAIWCRRMRSSITSVQRVSFDDLMLRPFLNYIPWAPDQTVTVEIESLEELGYDDCDVAFPIEENQ